MYNLPSFKIGKIREIKSRAAKFFKNETLRSAVALIVAGCIVGVAVGGLALRYFPQQTQAVMQYLTLPQVEQEKSTSEEQQDSGVYVSEISSEQAVINAVKNALPSVVSIVISKNVPVYEQRFVNPFGEDSPFSIRVPQQVQSGTEYQEVGAGSGFIVSESGLVITNKHVVSDTQADYTVYTNDGEKYSSKVLARDPVQDLAILQIEASDKKFQPAKLGNSSGVQIGQTVIAIGNALGQFDNTISMGIISGLARTVSATDQVGSFSEKLENIIQTDAAINSGNSGGPLLNLKGEVIGINTAMAQGAENIAFAIPVNYAKKDIEQVSKNNKIVYPFLGVRYVLVDSDVQKEYKLSVDYGAFIMKGTNGEAAITSGSAAEKAGLKNGDVILLVNGEKITTKNSLATVIQKYNAGDTVTLHILRDEVEQDISVTFGERSS